MLDQDKLVCLLIKLVNLVEQKPPVLRCDVCVDAELCVFLRLPFGVELHLQYNVQSGLQYWF